MSNTTCHVHYQNYFCSISSNHVERSFPVQSFLKKKKGHVTRQNEDYFSLILFHLFFYMLLKAVFQIFYVRNYFTLAHLSLAVIYNLGSPVKIILEWVMSS